MAKNTELSQSSKGYVSVNGLKMYYEIHGEGRPLALHHGALSAIGTSFGKLLPSLARNRRVISIEQQAHGHTADINRPLTIEQMANDTAALLHQLEIGRADIFGWSMGAGIALQIATRHPDLVAKLVVASVAYTNDGLYPEVLEGKETMKPESLEGTPWQEEYTRIAPHPEDWPVLIEKVKRMDQEFQGWRPQGIQAIMAPTLIIVGDSDIIRPEHAVELFRLLGGGVPGDLAGLPRSQLAVLPGTTHVTLVERVDWLLSMITAFLDAPIPKGK